MHETEFHILIDLFAYDSDALMLVLRNTEYAGYASR